MTAKVIGTISAGSSPAYEVVEDEEFPWQIVIRVVDSRSEQVRIARTAVPVLIQILGRVREDKA